MIELLVGWITSVKTALLYIALYTAVMVIIRVASLYWYFRSWDKDDKPPGPYYTP